MNEREKFVQTELERILRPNERIEETAYVVKQPGLMVQILLLGPIFIMFMTKAFYIGITSERIVLIRTKLGFFSPSMDNRGITEYERSNVESIKISGFANNRSFTFFFRDGSKETFRIAPWSKVLTGNKTFLEALTGKFKSKS